MKKLCALSLILLLFILCGCETARGLGRDFENLGNWIQDKAR